MFDGLGFTELLILTILRLICFVGFVVCACGLWTCQRHIARIQKSMNIRVKSLATLIGLYDRRDGHEDC